MIIQNQSFRESLLRLFKESLSAAGTDAQNLMARYGVDCSALDTWGAFALSDALNQLWTDAEVESGNPAVALSIPREAGYGLGVVTQLVLSARTVRGALQAIARRASLVCPTLSLSLLEVDGQCRIELKLAKGAEEAVPHRHDFLALLLVQHIRVLTGCPFTLQRYHRPGSVPADTGPWESAFACPVSFGADPCMIVLSAQQLDYPLPSGNLNIFEFCDRLVSRGSEGGNLTCTSRVRRAIEELVRRGEPRREEVASQLCISSRSLSRRLASEGTSFAALVNDVRRELAEQYLKGNEFNLNEITYALGFGDPSNFYRACKRWFGGTPQMVRQQKCRTLHCTSGSRATSRQNLS